MVTSPTETARSTMEVGFPGGKAVAATYRGHVVVTDQPVRSGGSGAAPSPFDLFLASIGTCAGFYALEFCRRREIPTDDLGLTLETERDPERRLVSRIRLRLRLPSGFPDKYRAAIARAIDQCSVKRHLTEAPTIELELSRLDQAS